GTRSPAASQAAAAGRARAYLVAEHAPHHLRCLVHARAGARTDQPLHRLCGSRPLPLSRTALAVRRLCRLATAVVTGRGAREPGTLLDHAAQGSRPPGAAHRPSSSRRAELPRCAPESLAAG